MIIYDFQHSLVKDHSGNREARFLQYKLST